MSLIREIFSLPTYIRAFSTSSEFTGKVESICYSSGGDKLLLMDGASGIIYQYSI